MAERNAMMDATHALSISRQGPLAGISRGSIYDVPKSLGAADLGRMRRLEAWHLEHPFMGAQGYGGALPKPRTSKKHPGHEIYPYLLRGLYINRANQVWALETPYIPMAKGFVSLTAFGDRASRKVLAPKVAITLETCHAVEVLHEAVTCHGRPKIVNIDQGSQFSAQAFMHAAKKQDAIQHGRTRSLER